MLLLRLVPGQACMQDDDHCHPTTTLFGQNVCHLATKLIQEVDKDVDVTAADVNVN